jgi:hypothetical protein
LFLKALEQASSKNAEALAVAFWIRAVCLSEREHSKVLFFLLGEDNAVTVGKLQNISHSVQVKVSCCCPGGCTSVSSFQSSLDRDHHTRFAAHKVIHRVIKNTTQAAAC